MKNVILFLAFALLAFTLPSCAQRDINTSSARAAYNIPTGYEQVMKSKRKKKHSRNKVSKIKRREAKKNSTDAARHRRKSLFF